MFTVTSGYSIYVLALLLLYSCITHCFEPIVDDQHRTLG
jgi:hypothetical protein